MGGFTNQSYPPLMEPVISQEAGTEPRAVLNEASRHIPYLFPYDPFYYHTPINLDVSI